LEADNNTIQIIANQFQNIVDQNVSEQTDELRKSTSSPSETGSWRCVYLQTSARVRNSSQFQLQSNRKTWKTV